MWRSSRLTVPPARPPTRSSARSCCASRTSWSSPISSPANRSIRCVDYALNQRRLVCSSLRAKEAVETLLRVLSLQARTAGQVRPSGHRSAQPAIWSDCCAKRAGKHMNRPISCSRNWGSPRDASRCSSANISRRRPGRRSKGEPEVCPDCGGTWVQAGERPSSNLFKSPTTCGKALIEQPRLEVLRAAGPRSGRPLTAGGGRAAGRPRRQRPSMNCNG